MAWKREEAAAAVVGVWDMTRGEIVEGPIKLCGG